MFNMNYRNAFNQKMILIAGTVIVLSGLIFINHLKTAESSNKVLPIVYPTSTPSPSLTATPTVTPKYKPAVSKVLSPTPTEKPTQTNTSTSNYNSNNSTSQNNSQPTATPTIIIPTPTTQQITPTAAPSPTSAQNNDGISVDKTTVTVTLSRANADNGLIYGSGFVITSHGATGYLVWQNSQGVGFYESSGGLTNNSTQTIRTYINPNKPNGTYTGSAIVKYTDSNNNQHDGSTVSYSITLTD